MNVELCYNKHNFVSTLPPKKPERGRLPQIVADLKQLATTKGAGAKLPTLRQLAKRFDVSQATVVRALERLEADQVLVRRHGSGIYVTEGHGRAKILVLFEASMMISVSPVWDMIMRGVLRPFSDHPESVTVHMVSPPLTPTSRPSARDQLPTWLWSEIEAGKFAAMIAIGVDENVVWEIDRAGLKSASFATAGRFVMQLSEPELCQLGLQELLRMGCRKIAMFDVSDPSIVEFARTILRSQGVSLWASGAGGKQFIFPQDQRARVGTAFEAAIRTLGPDVSPEDRPDGALMIDDIYAQNFILGMRSMGLQPGKDLMIATHSNLGSPTLLGYESEIIRLEYDIQMLIDGLVYAAKSLMAGKSPDKAGWENAVVMEWVEGSIEILSIHPRLVPIGSN